MSQLFKKCHDYPKNVTITLKMSQLPSKCHDYPQVFDRKNGIKNEVVF